MAKVMTDETWYHLLKDVYDFEAKGGQDFLGLKHVDLPGLMTFFNTTKIAEFYYHQAILFQSQESKIVRGPFTLFMSRYFDGLAWFDLLVHINRQAYNCASQCYTRKVKCMYFEFRNVLHL